MIEVNSCLYCPDPPNSLEHPLLAAFGEFENAPKLEDRVCKACNENRLGILDEQLARAGLEAFLRRFYGITGRSGHEPVNPFYRGSAAGYRLEMKSYDKNLCMEVLLEVENGVPRQVCQLIFLKDGHPHHLPLREGTTPERLRAAYDELGIAKPEDVHVICDEQERTWVESLVQATWPSATLGITGACATSYDGAVIEVRLTNRYFRAVAKMGFHYFLTQFSQYTRHEAMFADIRAYILDEQHKVQRANDYIGERQLPLIGEMLPAGTRPQGWRGHVLAAEIKGGVCLAHVQMFLSEEFPARTYTVRLAQTTDSDSGSGHLFAYYEDGPHGKYAGEAHPLEWARVALTPVPLRPVVVE